MSSAQKDTIYIDVDDEITGIIDKLLASRQKIVALVLPKRAAVLQSLVNMKLLKRTADEAGKKIVLITSEAGLLPLAGVVGVHVAKTLQSRPSLPAAPSMKDTPLTVSEDEVGDVSDSDLDPSKPIGELAGLPNEEEDETIEVDNDDEATAPAAVAAGAASAKKPFNKKLKIPNFEKFRVRLFLGIFALILLIVGLYFANVVMPKAKVTIKTDTSDITTNLDITARPQIDTVDEEKKIVPAENKELKKTDSQKVSATGEKDLGTKATGKVTFALSDCSVDQVNIPSGTGVSSNNLTFITQQDIALKSVKIGNSCMNSSFKEFSTGTTSVTAQNAGDKYNLSQRNYSVSGFSNVTAAGTDMTGGTSKIVKVVSQQDVDNAKQKILDQNTQTATDEVTKQLQDDGYYPLKDTFTAGGPLVTSSPNIGDEAGDVTVNVTVTYTMTGAKEDGLKQLIESDAKQHIDPTKQSILDNGLSKAAIRITNKEGNGDIRFNLQTVVSAGPQLDADAIKKEIAGKKRGDAETLIKARPGITDAKVAYSPFWVTHAPKKTSKITIIFEKSENANSNQ